MATGAGGVCAKNEALRDVEPRTVGTELLGSTLCKSSLENLAIISSTEYL